MALSRREQQELLKYCGSLNDDDAIDPRDLAKLEPPQKPRNRKALQLCKQVEETLSLVLSGEFGDELLQNLQVVAVVPAPNTSQLAVTLAPDTDVPVVTAEILERLQTASGRLRAEIAAAITRKKTPRLVFQVAARQRA